MPELPTLNKDLEQTLYKATLREKQLRLRATLFIILPICIGAVWLWYSASELSAWRKRSQDLGTREAALERHQDDARLQIADADAQRNQALTRAQALESQEKTAQTRTDDLEQRLARLRDETAGLSVLLYDLNTVRAKASKFSASEAVESQLGEIRSALARSLGRIHEQIDSALPATAQKPRVFLFITDEQQRAPATQLKAALEKEGFVVGEIAKNSGHRVDATEVRYFHEPQDKDEAGKIVALLEQDLGQPNARAAYTADPDHIAAPREFQVWFGKTQATR